MEAAILSGSLRRWIFDISAIQYRISHLPLPPHTSDSFSVQDLPLKPKACGNWSFETKSGCLCLLKQYWLYSMCLSVAEEERPVHYHTMSSPLFALLHRTTTPYNYYGILSENEPPAEWKCSETRRWTTMLCTTNRKKWTRSKINSSRR